MPIIPLPDPEPYVNPGTPPFQGTPYPRHAGYACDQQENRRRSRSSTGPRPLSAPGNQTLPLAVPLDQNAVDPIVSESSMNHMQIRPTFPTRRAVTPDHYKGPHSHQGGPFASPYSAHNEKDSGLGLVDGVFDWIASPSAVLSPLLIPIGPASELPLSDAVGRLRKHRRKHERDSLERVTTEPAVDPGLSLPCIPPSIDEEDRCDSQSRKKSRELKKREEGVKRKELELVGKEEKARQKEEEIKRKELELTRREEEGKQMEEEIHKERSCFEEERKEARRIERELREEIKRFEEERIAARQREEELRKRKDEVERRYEEQQAELRKCKEEIRYQEKAKEEEAKRGEATKLYHPPSSNSQSKWMSSQNHAWGSPGASLLSSPTSVASYSTICEQEGDGITGWERRQEEMYQRQKEQFRKEQERLESPRRVKRSSARNAI